MRNKIAYLSAQTASFGSSWALYIYLNWKIYTLYSINNLAIYALVSGLPALLFMNIGGILADKYNRKYSLIFLQFILVCIDLLLIFLLLTNYLTIEFMLIYGVVIGLLGAFSRPFHQAILFEIVDKDDVPIILGFNSVIFNLCRIFVPLIVGILIIDYEYAIVGLSILLSITSLIFYNLLICKNLNTNKKDSSFVELFGEQRRIIMQYPELIKLFFVAMIISITLGSYTFLIPALNEFLHNGDPRSLSYLYGISGAGALSAGVFKIYNKNIKTNFIPLLGILASVAMATLIYQNKFYVEVCAFYTLALCILLIFISCNQAIYDMASQDQHGRLLSIFGMGVIGIAPFSNAMTGFLVGWMGLEMVCLLYAAICGLFCLGVSFRSSKSLPTII